MHCINFLYNYFEEAAFIQIPLPKTLRSSDGPKKSVQQYNGSRFQWPYSSLPQAGTVLQYRPFPQQSG
jgi:hypothetical protein